MNEFLSHLANHNFVKAKKMIEQGFDINSKIAIKDDELTESIPIINFCTLDKNKEAIKFLIQENVDLCNMDDSNFCPLFYAASQSDLSVFQLMINSNVKFTATNLSQKVVIELLVEKNQLELLSHKFNEIENWHGVSQEVYEKLKIGFEKLQLEHQISEMSEIQKPKLKL